MTTSILLFFPLGEDKQRIIEVNKFTIDKYGSEINLVDIDNEDIKGWYGGGKYFSTYLLIGEYKGFGKDLLETFIEYLKTKVNWEYPEYVELVVRLEGAERLAIYRLVSETIK